MMMIFFQASEREKKAALNLYNIFYITNLSNGKLTDKILESIITWGGDKAIY